MANEAEQTLGQFLDHKWTQRLGRLALILFCAFAGSAVTYFFTLANRIAAIEQDRAVRIVQNDKALATLSSGIDRLKGDVATVKLDVGVVKGILLDIQRREQVAEITRRLNPPDPSLP